MKIKIIYETQVGTTKYVAEIIQKKLSTLGHEVDLHSLRTNGRQPDLTGYDAVLFGSPTYNSGQPEPTVSQFMNEFQNDLSPYKVAVFSLGDRSYPEFCGSAEILETWITGHGGNVSIPSLKIDGYPMDFSPILAWAEQFAQTAVSSK